MNSVTVIWSMVSSACLTLGAIYGLVWYKNRTAWAHLFFSATAFSTAAFAFCELSLMRAETPAELLTGIKWGHVAILFWLVSVIWFVRLHLGAGRLWLAGTLCVLRALYLLAFILLGPTFLYREITSLRQVPLLGDQVTIFTVITTPWMIVGQVINFAIIFFVADASVTAWRRGERRKALIVGGGVEFFLILGMLESALIYWAQLPIPILLSPFYLGMVAVMGYEVSRDVLRASQLVRKLQVSEAELRESGARMTLAVDAADLGIWIRDLARDEVWASEKWRELFGFTPTETLDYDGILARLHPDDRKELRQAVAEAIAGADGSKYQVEYRVMLADGSSRWIASQGRVECDATGQPVLMRGAARDVTAAKHAEGVVRKLSGRLLVRPGGGAPADCPRTARQPEPAAGAPLHRDRGPGDQVRGSDDGHGVDATVGRANRGDFDGSSQPLAPAALDQAGRAWPSGRGPGALPRAAGPGSPGAVSDRGRAQVTALRHRVSACSASSRKG